MGLFGGMIEGYDSSQRHKANEANLRYQEELRRRQQMEWANQDAERAKFEEMAAAAEQRLNAPRQGFFESVGMQAPMVNSGQGLTGSRELEGVQTPMAAPAMAPRDTTAEDALKAQMAIARAGQRIPDYFNATAALHKQRIDADAAAIHNAILNMGESEFGNMANQVTIDKGNKYKLTPGKNGYVTLELDGTKASLSRDEVGRFFAAKHRMAAGDASGINEIASINKDIAAKVATQFAQMKDMGTMGNTATHYGHQDEAQRRQAAAAEARARAAEGHEKWQREQAMKTQFKPVSVNGVDPTTGRQVKTTIFAGMDPKTNKLVAQDIYGNQINDSKILAQIGQGEVQHSPEVETLLAQRQNLVKGTTPDNFEMASKQVATIDKQLAFFRERDSIAALPPEARTAKIKEYLGAKTPLENMVMLGFTEAEIKAAMNAPKEKPAAMAGATGRSAAPLRSVDGGKTWTVDAGETMRDPSVPYYRQVGNPAYAAFRGKSWPSRAEAEKAYNDFIQTQGR